jgi:hypothetical protein
MPIGSTRILFPPFDSQIYRFIICKLSLATESSIGKTGLEAKNRQRIGVAKEKWNKNLNIVTNNYKQSFDAGLAPIVSSHKAKSC